MGQEPDLNPSEKVSFLWEQDVNIHKKIAFGYCFSQKHQYICPRPVSKSHVSPLKPHIMKNFSRAQHKPLILYPKYPSSNVGFARMFVLEHKIGLLCLAWCEGETYSHLFLCQSSGKETGAWGLRGIVSIGGALFLSPVSFFFTGNRNSSCRIR